MTLAVLFGLCLVLGEPKLEPAQALAKYNEMKAKTGDTAAAQMKLAGWCEQNGLDAEASLHYSAVVRLSPGNETAWRKLGFKKRYGRWLNDDQIAAEDEQAKADKEWAPKLRKIHRSIHGGAKQDEALDAVAAIDDPKAIPSVYREFGVGSPKDQEIAIQILGQINTPLSSKVLAMLSIYAKVPDVRRRAVETLRRRDPKDYLPVLVGLLADPVKYEVKPVGGPGSPGVLFVEGERANVRRFYSAPAPNISFQPGDIIDYDPNGSPILIRLAGRASVPVQQMAVGKTALITTFANFGNGEQINLGQVQAEANKAAISSQEQLRADIEAIEAENHAKKNFNDLIMDAAKTAMGKEPGRDVKDWRDEVATLLQYKKNFPKRVKPTFDELAAPDYVPRITTEMAFVRSSSIAIIPPH